MSAERSIEVSGDSIEDAIAKGLSQLGVSPAEVLVEVLEDPKPAMFGMEARPARVRLQMMGMPAQLMPPMNVTSSAPAAPRERPPERRRERDTDEAHGRDGRERRERDGGRTARPEQGERDSARSKREERGERDSSRAPREDRGERSTGTRDGRRDAPPRQRDDRPRGKRDREQELLDSVINEAEEALPFARDEVEIPDAQQDEEAQVAKVVLNELLEKMDIRGRIVVRQAAADEQSGSAPYILDIMSQGNSNRLIGRNAETLTALQYITRLVTSRELQRRADVIVDVNSYKARRAQALTAQALRMADEAVQSGKTMILEPMPPHERRIIHLALRTRPDVSTRSIGEGAGRKVTIVPSGQSGE
ncbi:MAG: RNA-binding cell elongation regulator Jag/EloR [Chloroflexota bacterium]|nr:RNA-binding cell elongation regulator Jag/EloR [Chloroflexota bacterium]